MRATAPCGVSRSEREPAAAGLRDERHLLGRSAVVVEVTGAKHVSSRAKLDVAIRAFAILSLEYPTIHPSLGGGTRRANGVGHETIDEARSLGRGSVRKRVQRQCDKPVCYPFRRGT